MSLSYYFGSDFFFFINKISKKKWILYAFLFFSLLQPYFLAHQWKGHSAIKLWSNLTTFLSGSILVWNLTLLWFWELCKILQVSIFNLCTQPATSFIYPPVSHVLDLLLLGYKPLEERDLKFPQGNRSYSSLWPAQRVVQNFLSCKTSCFLDSSFSPLQTILLSELYV